ncbi:hypothetical protein, partial [uncultured Xylophilus sp.]|uniref:hypothetical protein n=1 Tax=uncultured Xylophilus sp. TaxID=296832 RepID=UPI0025CCBC2C
EASVERSVGDTGSTGGDVGDKSAGGGSDRKVWGTVCSTACAAGERRRQTAAPGSSSDARGGRGTGGGIETDAPLRGGIGGSGRVSPDDPDPPIDAADGTTRDGVAAGAPAAVRGVVCGVG